MAKARAKAWGTVAPRARKMRAATESQRRTCDEQIGQGVEGQSPAKTAGMLY